MDGDKPVGETPPPLDFSTDEDLFALPPVKEPRGPHTGRDNPATSHKAARAVAPKVGTIRQQVEDFARSRGKDGFIDEELIALAEDERHGDRSFRPRRTELTDANIILDSGRVRTNDNSLYCVVWVHRDFALDPPPVMEAKPAKAKPTPTRDLKAAFDTLNLWHDAMKREGRLVAGLREAIETVRRAAT